MNTNYSSNEKGFRMKKHVLLISIVFLLLFAALLFSNRAIIFQRGNPLPYLAAAMRISEDTPYAAVDVGEGLDLSRRGACPELFDAFQEKSGAAFVEQAGSGYLFSDGTNRYVISSEIYWGRYTVWTLPEIMAEQ